MSNVYVTEPATQGKVLLRTTFGDVDVELWPKEAPLACRNFCELALSGYYDGVIFHRIIRNFMAQTGDPTGSGRGGASAIRPQGGYFKDEYHQRIKFNHRGQVAMANESKPNTNKSQFFITLGECPWLNGKHTIFGKVTGKTIFNVLKLQDVDTDSADRPLDPPRIIGAEVLSCPFPDLEERIKQGEFEAPQKNDAANSRKKRKKSKKAKKKKFSLMSFGEEAEEEERVLASQIKRRVVSCHDVLDDKTLSKKSAKPRADAKSSERKTENQEKTPNAEAVKSESCSNSGKEIKPQEGKKATNRKRKKKQRTEDTLLRLAAFSARLQRNHDGVKRKLSTRPSPTPVQGAANERLAESSRTGVDNSAVWHSGGIGDNKVEDSSDDDDSWLHSRLAFTTPVE